MLTGTLKPFQEEPVDRFLIRGNLLVSYEMGLGKTVIGIAAAEELLGCGDISVCLIVCPPSLKYQWAQRLAQFTDMPTCEKKVTVDGVRKSLTIPDPAYCVIIDGKPYQKHKVKYSAADDRKRQYQSVSNTTDYVIIGYDNVTSDRRYVKKICKDMVILDEVTAIKTFKAKRTLETKRLLQAEFRLALTGTPMENGKPEEIFSIMQWVDEDVLGRWDLYDRSYIRRGGGGVVYGYKNMPVLHERLEPAMCRKSRNDPDVKPFLPDVEHDEWPVYLLNDSPLTTAYMTMGNELLARLKEAKRVGQFDLSALYTGGTESDNTELGKIWSVHVAMEMLLAHPDLLIESALRYEQRKKDGSKYAYQVWQDDLLDDVWHTPKLDLLYEKISEVAGFGEKILVFSRFRTALPYLEDALQPYHCVQYHGQMNASQKAMAVEAFRDPQGPQIFLSSWAGAYGTDMYWVRHLVNYDNPISAGTADQINARHVRLSSEFKQVYIHDMYTVGTIEERILMVQEMKRKVNAAVVDNRGADYRGRIDNTVTSLTDWLATTVSFDSE